jgi:hypothetical protein
LEVIGKGISDESFARVAGMDKEVEAELSQLLSVLLGLV